MVYYLKHNHIFEFGIIRITSGNFLAPILSHVIPLIMRMFSWNCNHVLAAHSLVPLQTPGNSFGASIWEWRDERWGCMRYWCLHCTGIFRAVTLFLLLSSGCAELEFINAGFDWVANRGSWSADSYLGHGNGFWSLAHQSLSYHWPNDRR